MYLLLPAHCFLAARLAALTTFFVLVMALVLFVSNLAATIADWWCNVGMVTHFCAVPDFWQRSNHNVCLNSHHLLKWSAPPRTMQGNIRVASRPLNLPFDPLPVNMLFDGTYWPRLRSMSRDGGDSGAHWVPRHLQCTKLPKHVRSY